jgi:hypothetical protein
MTHFDINRVIAQFVNCARLLAQCGFSGVEIHAAHGYLLCESSFSDLTTYLLVLLIRSCGTAQFLSEKVGHDRPQHIGLLRSNVGNQLAE